MANICLSVSVGYLHMKKHTHFNKSKCELMCVEERETERERALRMKEMIEQPRSQNGDGAFW